MFHTVKITAISIRPKKWDKDYNADKMERFFRNASKENPDIVIAPEGVLEGYVVLDVLEGHRTSDEALEIAEPIDGPYITRFQSLAAELKTCLCFGFAERIGTDVFTTAIFIDSQGDILGRYHKTQLAEGTDASCNFNRVGNKLRAFDTPFGRAGFVICNDRFNPMIVRTLVLDGAQFILLPSYHQPSSNARHQNKTVLARSRENGVPIVEANVGMSLIINKGEIKSFTYGHDQFITTTIDVPANPSSLRARQLENEYLALQGREMAQRYKETLKRIKGDPTAQTNLWY